MKQSQNQNNKRGRGRGRRQPQNPLSRNHESNGPDVKIRGTTAHIADKYMSLARDALSSGDRVSAENYFQHAEHYHRLIAVAKDQQKAADTTEEQDSATPEHGDNSSKERKKFKRRQNGKSSKANGTEEMPSEKSSDNEVAEQVTEQSAEAVEDSADSTGAVA